MPYHSLSKIAYGTINPMRFVQDAPGIINGALQCTGAGVPIIGIAYEGTTAMYGTQVQTSLVPQGYPAAASGNPFRLYEENDPDTMVIVGSGYTVLPNEFLTSDASGNAVPLSLSGMAAGTVAWVGARAIEGGDAGNPIRVQTRTFPYTKPA